ncbi:MAG: PIG-L family deacetylase [Clostridia bacterium]|nr:PIG-L family deacetylase [Clostridia bacterium]
MNVLVVVAHPDDEVLGAGGTMCRFAREGHRVFVCVLSGEARARAHRPADNELIDDFNSCLKKLGVEKSFIGDFPNIEMNTVSHLHLVQFIEKALMESKAELVITHHPSDTNNDHHHTSVACQAAIRLFQRRPDATDFRELWFMEVPSSTEWSVDTSTNRFQPNTFMEIGEEGIQTKIEALACYRGVMRDYPHPRSVEALRGLAAYRGAQSGLCYAEGFESAFRRVLHV